MSNVTLEDRERALENEYFHRKEQELIEKMRAKLNAESTIKTDLQCPKCDGTMHEADFENLRIDVCDKCHGVWLDAGELAQITHHDENKESWFGKIFG